MANAGSWRGLIKLQYKTGKCYKCVWWEKKNTKFAHWSHQSGICFLYGSFSHCRIDTGVAHDTNYCSAMQISVKIGLFSNLNKDIVHFDQYKLNGNGPQVLLTMDFRCSGFMAGSCCSRRQALWKRAIKALSNAVGSDAGTSQNRSETTGN